MTKMEKSLSKNKKILIVVIDKEKDLESARLKARIEQYKKEFQTKNVIFLDFKKDLSPSEWVLCEFQIPVFIHGKNGKIENIIYGY